MTTTRELHRFEVVALYDDERNGVSGFTDHLVDGNEVYKSLTLQPEMFQPGTEIIIRTVECPTCKRPTTDHVKGVCPCGHDWIEWCKTRYQAYEPEQNGQDDSTA